MSSRCCHTYIGTPLTHCRTSCVGENVCTPSITPVDLPQETPGCGSAGSACPNRAGPAIRTTDVAIHVARATFTLRFMTADDIRDGNRRLVGGQIIAGGN